MGVRVSVAVNVLVFVGVAVGVSEFVAEGVSVKVGDGVGVSEGVGVFEAVGVGVSVARYWFAFRNQSLGAESEGSNNSSAKSSSALLGREISKYTKARL